MEKSSGKKVLIVGSSAIEYSLAENFSLLEQIEKVYAASGNPSMKDFCETIDIREDNLQELLEFVLENAIDLTIASSEKAIKNDIASYFQANNQQIFAPSAQSSNICISKSAGKKFMYKNHILCPKFAIFDKPAAAIDYIKNSPMPLLIKTDEHFADRKVLVFNSFSSAKKHIEELFDFGEKKIIIEDFINGHEFSFYVITDGYQALPLGTAATYKYELEGNGGFTTKGMGSFVPDYKISSQIENKIMQNVIYPTINALAKNQTPYIGILGVDFILTGQDRLFAIEFNSFLQAPEGQDILGLLDEDIYNLFHACAIGSFADDYNQILIKDYNSASCVLTKNIKANPVISGLKELDEETKIAHFNSKKNNYLEYEALSNNVLVITKQAKTLSRAISNLYEEISLINFEGIKFRKDIGK